MPAVNWTDAARTQLLLIIIHLGTPPKWDQVAQLLNNGCTAEAARYAEFYIAISGAS